MDGAITDNGEGQGWNHVEYDSFWDAAAQVTADGWSAEMRIPFSSLRFRQEPDGTVRMGLIAGRYISRKAERHVFPDIRPGPAVAHYKPSLAEDVVLEGVQSHRTLYVRPYVLGGVEAPPTEAAPQHDLVTEIGGDLKIGLTRDMTLDLSLNTDFAQTEVDDQRVNLTRYSLLYPERRAFFLERSGTFSMDAGASVRLFHSRTIGLSPEGTPEQVYGGARLVGRLGSWDLGALDVQGEGPAEGAGSTNSGVLRLRRDLLGPESYVGGMVTTFRSHRGDVDTTVGLDGTLNIAGDDFLSFVAGATPGAAGSDLGREGLVHAVWERRDLEGWSYRGEITRIGRDFQPALGFVARAGVTETAGRVAYGWFGGETFQGSAVALDGDLSRRHSDGGIEAARVGLAWRGEKRGGGKLETGVGWLQEGITQPFELGRATIPIGTYRFMEVHASAETPNGRPLRSSLALSGGEFFDGYRLTGAVSPAWTASPFLEVGGDLEVNRVWFPSRGEEYDATVARLRLRISPSTRLAVHGSLQHHGALDNYAANVRVRYTIHDGNDVYLVLRDGTVGPTDGAASVSRTRTRSLLVKVSMTIR